MKTGVILIYDGTFNGFLSGVYQAFEQRMEVVDIQQEGKLQSEFFAQTRNVVTVVEQAKQVWFTLREKNYESLKNLYFAFLSEVPGIELQLYRQIVALIKGSKDTGVKCTNPSPFNMADLAARVAQEKRKTETGLSLDFPKGKAPVVYLKPRYNILPLISKYFRLSYPSGPWMIFDRVRNYGLYYDGFKVTITSEVPLQFQMADAA